MPGPTFDMSEKEWEKASKFLKHRCKIKSTGTSGGKITYEFSPTGVGLGIKVRCDCGKFKDVTDYESW